MKVKWINAEDFKKELEIVGWLASVSSDTKDPSKYMNIAKHCIKSGHLTVTRSMRFMFEIEGISRVCYDDETEILTYNGWKKFKDVKLGERVITYNGVNSEFQCTTDIIENDFEGELHYYASDNIDLAVTPEHKLLIKPYDVRTKQDFRLVKSKDIKYKRFNMKKLIEWNQQVDDTVVIKGFSYDRRNNSGGTYVKNLDDLVLDKKLFTIFIAWYLSDGNSYYDKLENKYTIHITQKDKSIIDGRELNRENREEIFKVIQDLGFNPSIDGKEIKFNSQVLGKFLATLGKSYDKTFPFNLFEYFNKELADLFINTYVKGDGHTHENGHRFLCTTSEVMAGQLQIIAHLAGKTANIRVDDRVGQERYILGKKSSYKHKLFIISLAERNRNIEPVVKLSSHFSSNYYKGKTYCVTVPNGVIFTRRNGKTSWCGNCSHEFVRHEMGVIKCQESQRYVDASAAEFVTPEEIRDTDEDAFEMTILESFANYQDLLDAGYKKEIARYTLTGATCTKINVCFNWEGLTNFFAKRLCRRAQPEMQELAQRIYTELSNKMPQELYDFVMPNFGPKCDTVGYCTEVQCCGKSPTKEKFMATYERGRFIEDGK